MSYGDKIKRVNLYSTDKLNVSGVHSIILFLPHPTLYGHWKKLKIKYLVLSPK
jgi:hypothetical protein